MTTDISHGRRKRTGCRARSVFSKPVHWLRIAAVSARTGTLLRWRQSGARNRAQGRRCARDGIRSRRVRHRGAPHRDGGAPGAPRRVALALEGVDRDRPSRQTQPSAPNDRRASRGAGVWRVHVGPRRLPSGAPGRLLTRRRRPVPPPRGEARRLLRYQGWRRRGERGGGRPIASRVHVSAGVAVQHLGRRTGGTRGRRHVRVHARCLRLPRVPAATRADREGRRQARRVRGQELPKHTHEHSFFPAFFLSRRLDARPTRIVRTAIDALTSDRPRTTLHFSFVAGKGA